MNFFNRCMTSFIKKILRYLDAYLLLNFYKEYALCIYSKLVKPYLPNPGLHVMSGMLLQLTNKTLV
jgi:hypothetical protein